MLLIQICSLVICIRFSQMQWLAFSTCLLSLIENWDHYDYKCNTIINGLRSHNTHSASRIFFFSLLSSLFSFLFRGIGIVNAMEVIQSFPGQNGLKDFRQWVYSPLPDKKPARLSRADKKDPIKIADYDLAMFKYRHRNMRTIWDVSMEFPNEEVVKAYRSPEVDSSTERFHWSDIDRVSSIFVLLLGRCTVVNAHF